MVFRNFETIIVPTKPATPIASKIRERSEGPTPVSYTHLKRIESDRFFNRFSQEFRRVFSAIASIFAVFFFINRMQYNPVSYTHLGDNICLKLFGMQVYVADLYQLMSTGLNLI